MPLLSKEALYALARLHEAFRFVRVGRHMEPLFGYYCRASESADAYGRWDDCGHGWTPDEAILSMYRFTQDHRADQLGRSMSFLAPSRPPQAPPPPALTFDELRCLEPVLPPRERVITLEKTS